MARTGLDVIRSHCVRVGACVVWVGSKDRGGRPLTHVGDKRSVPIRRLVVEERTGAPVPRGFYACATCTTEGCVEHVKAVTRKEQMAFAAAAGKLILPVRTAKVTAHRRETAPKMTMEKADLLRQKRRKGATLKALGAEFDIHFSMAARICKGISWAHQGPPITRIPTPAGRFDGPPVYWELSDLGIGRYVSGSSAIARSYGA